LGLLRKIETMEWKFDFKQFGEHFTSLLKYGDSLHKVSKEMGVSVSTLSRMQQGRTIDVNTMINVHEWMMESRGSDMDLHDFVKHVDA